MIEHELVCGDCSRPIEIAPVDLYACPCGFRSSTLADMVLSGKTRPRQSWRIVGMTKRDGLKGRGAAVEFRSKK